MLKINRWVQYNTFRKRVSLKSSIKTTWRWGKSKIQTCSDQTSLVPFQWKLNKYYSESKSMSDAVLVMGLYNVVLWKHPMTFCCIRDCNSKIIWMDSPMLDNNNISECFWTWPNSLNCSGYRIFSDCRLDFWMDWMNIICKCPSSSQNWGKKQKSTTKVTLRATNKRCKICCAW